MKMKTKIIVLLLLFCTFSGYSQCDLAKKLFEDDLYASKELREYTSKADDPDKVFDAWRLLHDDKFSSKIDPTILKEVENNYQTIKNAGGYMKWKAVQGAGSVFGKNAISSINGFSDNVASILSQRGLSLGEFKLLQQKRYDPLIMSVDEIAHVDAIRSSIPLPNGTTVLQKVVPKNDIVKYTSGQYTQIGGFVSTAKDAKHLNSFDDIYYGMRLDYTANGVQPFNLSDGSCGIIRYKTSNPNLTVPKLPTETGVLPYSGNGFTGGNSGRLGVPEWKSPYNTPQDGAELWEVFSDGSEILRARFSTVQNKFITIP
jgi:hypothetical protein